MGGGKAKGKKGIKDTVLEDDFEVSVFLTEGLGARHAVLRKVRGVFGDGEGEREGGGEGEACCCS